MANIRKLGYFKTARKFSPVPWKGRKVKLGGKKKKAS